MFQHLVGAIGKPKMKLTWPLNSRRALPSRKKVHACTHVQTTHTEYHTMPVKIQFWGSECTQKEDTVATPLGCSAVHMTEVWISHPGSWWAGLSSPIRGQADGSMAVLYLPSLGHMAPEAAMTGGGEGSRAERFLGVSTSLVFPLHYQNRYIAREAEEWQGSCGWQQSDKRSTPRLKPMRCCCVSAPGSQPST